VIIALINPIINVTEKKILPPIVNELKATLPNKRVVQLITPKKISPCLI